MYIPDGINHCLCPRCVRILCDGYWGEVRPPWQPDARARKTALLMKVMVGTEFVPEAVANIIAQFIHQWWAP